MKGGWGEGKWGADMWGEGSGGVYAGMGHYPMGYGDMGWGTSDWVWSSRGVNATFRDGVYFFAIRKLDRIDNRDIGPGVFTCLQVHGVPREPEAFSFTSYVDGTPAITFSWERSLDVEDPVAL